MKRDEPLGWIKICGMTSAAAVDAALQSGADAIGFVFAPSVRQVSAARAAELARPARGFVTCVAVTLHPRQAELDAILGEFAPDVLQTDAEDLDLLRLPASLPVLPVLRGAAQAARCSGGPMRVLFEGERSGAGQPADWQAAAALAAGVQVVLAGGLNADNVRGAIDTVRPFGVDTSSGVESAPGVKSPQLIGRFVAAARAAFAETVA